MLVVCHKLGGPQGGPHIVKTFFYLKKKTKKRNKLETQKQNKNQGNILVLLHFNQAIVLLWCSHYGINVARTNSMGELKSIQVFKGTLSKLSNIFTRPLNGPYC